MLYLYQGEIIMIISYSINGYKPFNENVELSLNANKKILNKDYVFNISDSEVLKSAIIYGPNNTGKSSLLESIALLKNMVLDGKIYDNYVFQFDYNFFKTDLEMDFYIKFFENNDYYDYYLNFNNKDGVTLEKLLVNDKTLFDRNNIGINDDVDIVTAVNLIKEHQEKLVISLLPAKFRKNIDDINNFFNKIICLKKDILYADVVKEILSLSKEDFIKFKKVMVSADISIKDLDINDSFKDNQALMLISDYYMNGIERQMPSIISDSDGTKVFMYYIVNIIKCLKNGGVMIIDELDRSLHTLLAQNIINIFNNEKNHIAQLITTSHDLQLLDCLYLFRKDQVWFTYKDEKKVYLYSLDTFKCNKDKQIRNKTMESYLKNMFGALPHPNIDQYIFDEK